MDEKLANDLFFYINDSRQIAFSAKEGWHTLRAIGSLRTFLESQEANMKRTTPSMTQGEWAGTSADSLNESTTSLLSVEK